MDTAKGYRTLDILPLAIRITSIKTRPLLVKAINLMDVGVLAPIDRRLKLVQCSRPSSIARQVKGPLFLGILVYYIIPFPLQGIIVIVGQLAGLLGGPERTEEKSHLLDRQGRAIAVSMRVELTFLMAGIVPPSGRGHPVPNLFTSALKLVSGVVQVPFLALLAIPLFSRPLTSLGRPLLEKQRTLFRLIHVRSVVMALVANCIGPGNTIVPH